MRMLPRFNDDAKRDTVIPKIPLKSDSQSEPAGIQPRFDFLVQTNMAQRTAFSVNY
jgi:hypothetical protein